MKKYIKNGFVLQKNEMGWDFNRKNILINDGFIESITDPNTTAISNDFEIIDAHDNYIIPSFINAHYHSHDNLGRGIGLEQPLELWTYHPAAFRENLSPDEAYISTLIGCVDLISTGCTGVIDQVRFSNENQLDCVLSVIEAYQISGIRAIIVPVLNDLPIEETLPLTEEEKILLKSDAKNLLLPPEEQLDRVKYLIQKIQEKQYKNVRIGIGPSGPQRCSDYLLQQASDLARNNNSILHMHVLESVLQQQISKNKYNGSLIKHLDKLEILNENTHLVHMVWATDEDLEIVANRKCSIIYNPISNVFLGSGLAPIHRMRELKIPIALGTDDICCNGSHNFFETMKWASLINRVSSQDPKKWMDAQASFEMATLGGAIAFGKQKKLGEIEINMAADFTFIDSSIVTNLENNSVRKIVYSLMPSNISQVWVGGDQIYDDKKIIRFNTIDLFREAKEIERKRSKAFINKSKYPKECFSN